MCNPISFRNYMNSNLSVRSPSCQVTYCRFKLPASKYKTHYGKIPHQNRSMEEVVILTDLHKNNLQLALQTNITTTNKMFYSISSMHNSVHLHYITNVATHNKHVINTLGLNVGSNRTRVIVIARR